MQDLVFVSSFVTASPTHGRPVGALDLYAGNPVSDTVTQNPAGTEAEASQTDLWGKDKRRIESPMNIPYRPPECGGRNGQRRCHSGCQSIQPLPPLIAVHKFLS